MTMKTGWEAKLGLVYDKGRTVLQDKRHTGPLLVQKALYREGDAVCRAIIVHPPGGIVGGDRLAVVARLGENAQALFTTPGATRWYRSKGMLEAAPHAVALD